MPSRPTPEIIRDRLHKAIDAVIMPDRLITDRYVQTYEGMLRDFAKASEEGWTAERVVECVRLVYTWMPARGPLRIDMDVSELIAVELNLGIHTDRLIKLASELAKNSMVSGSKFLHFYDPARFPITDSWLQELSGTPSIPYRVDFYLDYKAGVHLVKAEHAKRACEWASRAFGYEVHRTRAIEAVAFYLIKDGWRHDTAALETA
jgi:hypothetical protein